MATVLHRTESIPLVEDEAGTVRLADTRVTLDVIAESFRQGSTAEQIADQFPTLRLDDIYAVITWMLRHPQELAAYLQRRDADAARLQTRVEQLSPPDGFRARLLARAHRQS